MTNDAVSKAVGGDVADALVIVDVQRAFISGPEAVPGHVDLQRAVGLLLQKARSAGVPVIFLQNDGPKGAVDKPETDGWQLFFAAKSGEVVVRKRNDDGFDGTDLEDQLRRARSRRSRSAACFRRCAWRRQPARPWRRISP